MGNNNSLLDDDVLSQSLNRNRELDISTRLSQEEFSKLLNGEDVAGCLVQWPAELLADVSLYERVNAAFNAISHIPVELPLRLPHLSYLNLNYNRLHELPESVALLFHLEQLHLSHNRLRRLPRNFVRMRRLLVLDLSYNQFERIDAELGQIASLRRLNISHNQLRQLPQSLSAAAAACSLHVLLADGNCLADQQLLACCGKSDELLAQLRRRTVANTSDAAVRTGAGAGVGVKDGGVPFPRVLTAGVCRLEQLQCQSVATGAAARAPLLPPAGASRLDAARLRDALAGLVMGAALGDALGTATDGMRADQALFSYGRQYQLCELVCDWRWHQYRPGDGSLNTQLMTLVLDSLLHWSGILDELDLAARLSHWWRHQERHSPARLPLLLARVLSAEHFVLQPHATAHQQMGLLQQQQEEEQQQQEQQHCQPDYDLCLTAALVCGVPQFQDWREVQHNAVRVCRTTHHHWACEAVCVWLALLVARLMQGSLLTAADVAAALRHTCERACQLIPPSGSQHQRQQALRSCLEPHRSDSSDCETASDQTSCAPERMVLSAMTTVCRVLTDTVPLLLATDHNSSSTSNSYQSSSSNSNNVSNKNSSSGSCGINSSGIAASAAAAAGGGGGGCGGGGGRDAVWWRAVAGVTAQGGRAAVAGSLCGGLLGAIAGYSQLPLPLVQQLNSCTRDQLHHKLNQLMDLMAL